MPSWKVNAYMEVNAHPARASARRVHAGAWNFFLLRQKRAHAHPESKCLRKQTPIQRAQVPGEYMLGPQFFYMANKSACLAGK